MLFRNMHMFNLICMMMAVLSWPAYAEAAENTPVQTAPDTSLEVDHKDALRVYIDPVTGKRTMPPPGAMDQKKSLSKSLAPRTGAKRVLPSSSGLREYNLGPGKGHAIDMRGHFNRMRATVGPHGRVSTQCDRSGGGHAANGATGLVKKNLNHE